MVDADRGFGNGELLPAGFLREPISRLTGADVIYHYGRAGDAYQSPHTNTMYLAPSALTALVPDNNALTPTKGKVYALSGIGYPQRFFNSVESLGLEVIPRPMPDHHPFSIADITALQALPITTTAKDAVKLRTLMTPDNAPLFANIWVLPVGAVLSDGVMTLIDKLIAAISPKD